MPDKRWLHHLARGGLLSLLFALLISGARQISLTADEPSHVASGYSGLASGLGGLWTLPHRGHPLLIDAWLALPIYVSQPGIPLEQLDGWGENYGVFIEAFMARLQPFERVKLAVRAPEILLTLLLAAVVCRWGSDLWGQWAGTLALGVLVFDPTLLAHGRLATNDVGVVALGTLALYCTWRWKRQPSWTKALVAGIVLALTMLAKASGVLWVAAALLMMLETAFRRRAEGHVLSHLGQMALAGGVSFFLLWGSYGFSWGPVPGFPCSLPAPAHWEALSFQTRSVDERWVFALGRRKTGAWWWYFALAFLIKNPLPLLIGLVFGVAVPCRPSKSRWVTLGLFPLLYACTIMWKGLNVGYRHMLPVHPFLYLGIAGGFTQCRRRLQSMLAWRGVAGILGAWYIVGTALVYPYEIAYFNELVGGPDGGYRYLADSNLAWGQSDHILDAYAEAHPDVFTDPPAAQFRPAPGSYIMNASYLQGVGLGDPYAYEWFRHREPLAILNHSLLIYDVPPSEGGWFAQCEIPRAPLSGAAIVEGTGQESVRRARFDCTQAWLYPGGGQEAGTYVLDRALLEEGGWHRLSLWPAPSAPSDPFVARHLTRARLAFGHAGDAHRTAFALYEMPPDVVEWPVCPEAYASRGNARPDGLADSDSVEAPVALQGPLAFLGAVAYAEGESLEVETWWQVTEGPIRRPFSIIGQLVSFEGETYGMFDKLAMSPLTLLPGDIVVQRHSFPVPATAEREQVWVRTGAYWLDTMDRWGVVDVPGADALLVSLEVQ